MGSYDYRDIPIKHVINMFACLYCRMRHTYCNTNITHTNAHSSFHKNKLLNIFRHSCTVLSNFTTNIDRHLTIQARHEYVPPCHQYKTISRDQKQGVTGSEKGVTEHIWKIGVCVCVCVCVWFVSV